MKGFMIFLFSLILLPIANAACIIPIENLEVRENYVFCNGTYNIENGISIASDNVIVDCNKSALAGNGIGYGIMLQNRRNVVIKGCNILNYEIGIYLDNSNGSFINNNYLAKNKFGIALFNSFNNSMESNALVGNVNDKINYLQASLLPENHETIEKEQTSSPREIIEEVIKVKKPFLEEKEILSEVDFILSRYFNITHENLEITRRIFYNDTGKSAEIVLVLKPKKILLNVSIYEKIPKCVSAYASQIFSQTDYEVIKNDPLILWTFSRLDNEKEISYNVPKKIDDECKSLLSAFGIATGFEEAEIKKEGKKKKSSLLLISAVFIAAAALLFALIKKIKR